MSVNYHSGLAYGWKVSHAEYIAMMEACDYKYEDEFICLNFWSGDSDYIFGVWINRLSEDSDEYAHPIDMWEIAENLPSDFNVTHTKMLIEMEREDLARTLSSLYLIHQVS